MENFRSNLRYKIEKYMKLNNFSYKYLSLNGRCGARNFITNGGTKFTTLFRLSNVLNVDIRNLLMFDNHIHVFKNSFGTVGDFLYFVGKKYKVLRIYKGLSAVDVVKKLNVDGGTIRSDSIYQIENAKTVFSIPRFFDLLTVLGMTSDEFFLYDEQYEIKDQYVDNKITIEDFNERIYEIENAQGKMLRGDINISIDRLPTLHVFLRICKCLKIHPRDFFDFEKKEFEIYRLKNIDVWFNYLKNKMNIKYLKNNRYIELSTVFLFCNENNIPIVDFFDVELDLGKISQSGGVII